jgi:hypothetical protein
MPVVPHRCEERLRHPRPDRRHDSTGPHIGDRLSGQHRRLPRPARGQLDQGIQHPACGLVPLLHDAEVTDGEQAHLVPRAVTDVGRDSLHHRADVLLTLLCQCHTRQILLESQVNEAELISAAVE